MSFISDLLAAIAGKKANRTLADVEADLSRLAAEHIAAREAVAAGLKRRDEMLLTAGDQEIQVLDAELGAKRLVIERLEAIQPRLAEQLAAHRSAAKRKRWDEATARYKDASLSFRDALRKAIEARAAVMNAYDAARSVEEHASASLPPVTQFLTPQGLADYELILERWIDSQRPRPAPVAKPAAVTPAPAPKQPANSTPAPAAPKPKAEAPKQAPKAKFVPPAAESGESVKITVIKPGIEISGVGRAVAEQVDVPANEAWKIVASGGAEYSAALSP